MDRLEPHQLKGLVESCLKGDADARISFQNLFGETIYKYPLKAFRMPADKAADFYIYVFEKDRIFRRLGTFQGRNEAHFETYLCFYVLRDLFFEWRRNEKTLEITPLELHTPVGGPEDGERAFRDIVADRTSDDGCMGSSDATKLLANFVSNDVEKRAILKLLCLAEFDLNPDEIRFISQKSCRSYREIVTLIEELRFELTRKDERATSLQDQLDSIFGWILLYQKELARLTEKLRSVVEGAAELTKLRDEARELERKIEWRYRQQRQVKEQASRFRTTTPYKDIARVLNVPIGTVCSLVARTRADMLKTLGDQMGPTEMTAS